MSLPMHLTTRWDTTPTPPRALPTLNSESAILELRLCLYLCAEATSSWNPLCCRCFCTFGCWSGFVFQIGAAAPPTQKVEGKKDTKRWVKERTQRKCKEIPILELSAFTAFLYLQTSVYLVNSSTYRRTRTYLCFGYRERLFSGIFHALLWREKRALI